MEIRNKVFVVTGGSSGLGAGTVRMLLANRAKAVIADVNTADGEALAAELGPDTRFVETDVTSETSAKSAVDLAVSTYGALHGLVNCAGVAPPERVVGREEPHRLESFRRVIDINLCGTFNMIRLAAFVMSKQPAEASGERGVIVNTASIAAFEGQIAQAAYSASKAGVVGMTLPIARELARFGIRVVTIAPGTFETPMLLGLPKPTQESLAEAVPFPQRMGRPAEFAALVKHIVENEMLNGETIRLDGAIRMPPK